MIKTMVTALSIALMIPATVSVCASSKAPREEQKASGKLHDVWLTQAQAQRVLASIDIIMEQIRELSEQNKAPRPGAQPCDPSFPGCGTCDLSGVLEALCSIQLQLECICERQLSVSEGLASCCEVIGECTDESTLLDEVVDKSDIDALCISVVSLLKTILLELRGAFTSL